MGLQNAVSMVELVGASDLALTWHLTSNHYPPLSVSLVPTCQRAIELANEGDWDHQVQLPEGITLQDQETAPVSEIVCNFHLEAFLDA